MPDHDNILADDKVYIRSLENKPAVNEYQYELSSPSRSIALSGMVPTHHGESYATSCAWGHHYPVAAYWLGRFYFAAMRRPYLSVFRFLYLTAPCLLVRSPFAPASARGVTQRFV